MSNTRNNQDMEKHTPTPAERIAAYGGRPALDPRHKLASQAESALALTQRIGSHTDAEQINRQTDWR